MPRNKKISLPVQKPFPILKFPPEIRNHIWRILVVVDDVLKFRNYDHHAKIPESRLRSRKPTIFHQEDDERRLSSQLAVAFTCRQFYLEVTPIYYGENTFSPGFSRFRPMDPQFENFTDAIGPKNASNITRLQLDDWRIIFDALLHAAAGFEVSVFHVVWGLAMDGENDIVGSKAHGVESCI